ncbi:hypothetical protein [Streptomyces massasporeus]|uniref:hypothetical protein n=1 Tax=Streptomyces massasporeus TaxID=67324 RepID=UPI0036FF1A4F
MGDRSINRAATQGLGERMIDMSAWKDITVDVVDDLNLDPRNVRIEVKDTSPESDIIDDLFHNEKALSLVESICKIGLLTHEVPIAIKRDGKLIVVEGNRRVAALKAIQNPYLAPEHQARITRATQGVNRDALRTISVKLAPSEDDANQLIAAIHTGTQRVGWSPARQAAFFQAQIDAGKSPEYLISHYPTVEVKKFIIRSQILNLFRNAHYEDLELRDYIRRRNFPVSVLARLYDYEGFLVVAKIRVNEQKATVQLEAPQEQFDKMAEKIIGDIKTKHINTRTLNSTQSAFYIDYMDKLRDLVNTYNEAEVHVPGNVAIVGGTQAATTSVLSQPATPPSQGSLPVGGPTAQPAVAPAPKAGPAKKDPTPSKVAEPPKVSHNYLNLGQVKIDPAYPPAIHKIYSELVLINIKKYPNATLDLLRTFLEKSIKAYAEKLKVDLKQHAGQQSGSGFVQLGHCLTWLEEHLKNTRQTAFIQVIKKIRGNKVGVYTPTVDHMNAINHNHHVFATSDEVRDCWDGMEGLVRMMLKP